jgi:hypothetical protein
MKITKKWLENKNACQDGIDWFIAQSETDAVKIIESLIEQKQYSWANWLLVRIMSYRQYVAYAIFSAELVIDIYEKKYPNNKAPRQAIEAAKLCLNSPTKNNKKVATAYADDAAYAAYDAADDAAYAADDAAAYAAAAAAAYAAYAAADDAAYAADAYAAAAAAYAAAAAAYAADDAYNASCAVYVSRMDNTAAKATTYIKILRNGLSLLK